MMGAVARVLAWIVAVVAGMFFLTVWWDGVRSEADYGLDGTWGWIALAGAVVLVLAIMALLALYGKIGNGAVVGLIFLGLATASLGYALYEMVDEPDYASVGHYCGYVAQDRGELAQCLTLMTPGSVRFADNDNAVDFALGDGDCETDAGPFCERAKAERDFDRMIEDAQAELGGP
jgi:hypothetical protein